MKGTDNYILHYMYRLYLRKEVEGMLALHRSK